MSFFKKLLGTEKKPKTYYDEMSSLVVKAWRALAKENGTAPTKPQMKKL